MALGRISLRIDKSAADSVGTKGLMAALEFHSRLFMSALRLSMYMPEGADELVHGMKLLTSGCAENNWLREHAQDASRATTSVFRQGLENLCVEISFFRRGSKDPLATYVYSFVIKTGELAFGHSRLFSIR